jgi:transposase
MPITTLTEIRNSVRVLKAQGHSLREISRLLKLSRNTVRRILRGHERRAAASAPCDAPTWSRLEDAFSRARGNVVRVQQLLADENDLHVSYSTLTRWIREGGLRSPPQRSGEYLFDPGAEAQHDTSPHRVVIAGKPITAQCAGLVLAYSRRLFVQYYPRFCRFEAKHFLLEAARFMDGTCPLCVIDNTSVIVADGTGADAIIAPEMVAFARTLGFRFRAHAVGHADRKGRIERPFFYVETNFLPARSFSSFEDLNRQALAWCRDIANQKPKRALGMSPEAAYLIEKPYLQPLPNALPPVYEAVERVVDLYGYVSIDSNRYSVPERFVGQSVTVYKYPADIRICRRGTEIAQHPRLIDQRDARHTVPEHHSTPVRLSRGPVLEEKLLAGHHPSLERYAAALKQRAHGRGVRALRRLLELKRTYPSAPFLVAVEQALQFGLFDLGRLEKLILKQVIGDFFTLDAEVDDDA